MQAETELMTGGALTYVLLPNFFFSSGLTAPQDMPCSPLIPQSHRLVLETLGPLPDDRKAFRMINGVLVERTVKDVVPALKTNAEGLKKVLDDLVKQYKSKQDDLEKWKVGIGPGPPT